MARPLSAFFFSSRRRHTRSLCDWSSDVCSSDLAWFSLALQCAGSLRVQDDVAGQRQVVFCHVPEAERTRAFECQRGIPARPEGDLAWLPRIRDVEPEPPAAFSGADPCNSVADADEKTPGPPIGVAETRCHEWHACQGERGSRIRQIHGAHAGPRRNNRKRASDRDVRARRAKGRVRYMRWRGQIGCLYDLEIARRAIEGPL